MEKNRNQTKEEEAGGVEDKKERRGREKRKYKYKKMNIIFVDFIIFFREQSVPRNLMMSNFVIPKEINKDGVKH